MGGDPLRLSLVALLSCHGPAAPVLPSGEGPVLTVLTYNVNFERFDPATIEAIASADADLVLLQETTAQWEAALRTRLADVYPTLLFHPADPDGGMGLLARLPVRVHARLSSPVGGFPATCFVADTALGPLQLLHVHLHPPLTDGSLVVGYFTTGVKRATELDAYLRCFDTPPDLTLGDFNEGDGDAIDRLVATGLSDAASAFPPVTRTWSWLSDWGELEGRPDHVFFGPALVPIDVAVIEAGASDHRPLRVRLQRRTLP